MLIAVPLLALNLRPAVTSVGAVLADIRASSGMSAVLASVVVAAPVWCFAVGGALAYKLRVAWGTSRTVSLALVVLAVTLACRVIAGPYLLLTGTVLACMAIAVLGTLLPVITHAAPTKAWALLTGCYVAAMGGGSGIGALITPQVSGHSTWQWGVSGWALLAAAGLVVWRVAARRFTEPVVAAGRRPSPFTLRPAGIAWSTTLHFGLTSGFTFTIMGWLPSVLLDHSHVDPAVVGWMFTVAMALGVPIALLVPKWARAASTQSGLAIALCAPNLIAIGGLLLYPEITPWVWAVCLGLGMPAVGLALTLISLRAAPDGDTAAALSSMVQGFGYAIAGATALAAGLLHSSTQSWEWPLMGLLVVLCGQLITGMYAGLPTTVYAAGARPVPPPVPPDRRPSPYPVQRLYPMPRPPQLMSTPHPISQPLPIQRSQPVPYPVSPWPPQPTPRRVPSPSPRLEPVPVPVEERVSDPVTSGEVSGSVADQVDVAAESPVADAAVPEAEVGSAQPQPQPQPQPQAESVSVSQVESQSMVESESASRSVAESVSQAEPASASVAESVSQSVSECVPDSGSVSESASQSFSVSECAAEPSQGVSDSMSRPVSEPVVEPQGDDGVAPTPSPAVWDDVIAYPFPRQEALFDLPGQEALFEVPLPRQPTP